MIEPSQISNEIQAWTEIFEQKNNDRIEKMREEMDNKLEAILKKIKINKSASIVTNPRSDIIEMQDAQPSGSKTNKSIGVHAFNNENSDSENNDYPRPQSSPSMYHFLVKRLFGLAGTQRSWVRVPASNRYFFLHLQKRRD